MLEIINVTKLFGQSSAAIKALNNISLTVHKGDYIAVMGPSGSGKSTLLNIIGGLERISEGEVKLDGVRIDNMDENELVDIRRGKISYVFQQCPGKLLCGLAGIPLRPAAHDGKCRLS